VTRSSDARCQTKAEINETVQSVANAGRALSHCVETACSLTLALHNLRESRDTTPFLSAPISVILEVPCLQQVKAGRRIRIGVCDALE